LTPAVHKSSDEWHANAKAILGPRLSPGSRTINQLFPRHRDLGRALVDANDLGVPSKTIQAVKGQEFPAICVVTTAQKLGKILTFLENGTEQVQAEEA
jgi:DNA helicase-2/ATP-dependent DNA helicase PcrA